MSVFNFCLAFTANAKEALSLDAFTTLPAITQASVSNDGKKLALLRATSKNGDYIIEIRDVDNLKGKPVTLGADRMEISGFSWLNNEKLGVQFRQNIQDGADNYWASKFAIVNATGKGKWLVPFKKDRRANFSILSSFIQSNDEILITYDINQNGIPDVIRFNINTGRYKTVTRGNKKQYGGFINDMDGEIRAASGYDPKDNSFNLYARKKGSGDWKLIKKIYATEKENYDILGFSAENTNEIYVNANMGEDKTGIYLYNLETEKYSDRIFGLKSVNTRGITRSAKKETLGKLTGFTYTSKHPEVYYTDESEAALYQGVKAIFKDKFVRLISRSEDDNAIVVYTLSGKDPGTYYLLKDKSKIEVIGNKKPLLKEEDLSNVKYISYTARDGRKIPAYITVPNTKGPHPTVVMPHGGPWSRDVVIFDEWSQLLASHGYLVIQPQFRGSTGYGIEHWEAGDKNWGLTMQDDLDDAANFLVEKGLADKDRLAMFGWSYGGYAAFVASTRKNNIYQCSIAGAGVSSLDDINATLNSNPFSRERQRPTIKGISPIEHVDEVNIPILVIHGDIDLVVPVSHSREFVEKLVKYKKDHKYIELEGAAHTSDKLYYDHKVLFYSELLKWLDTKCGAN